MTIRLILDCDTGTDDAVAIMAAALHPDLDLIAVTTVNGNVPLKNTTDNSLRVLDHISRDIPVYPGAPRPLVRPDFPVPRRVLNGEDGIHPLELPLPAPTSKARAKNAVRFLLDTYMDDANADVVLVAVGPLTNVALALSSEPSLASRIRKLVIMGGASGWGNVTGSAEFNIWVDPEAAETVFTAGIRDVLVVPLNATHSAALGLADCDRFDAIGTPAATASADLIRHRILHENGQDAEHPTTAVHDALCIASLVNPNVLTEVDEYTVHVETAGTYTIGETVLDSRSWRTEGSNARVALRADAKQFADFLAGAFSSTTPPSNPRMSGEVAGLQYNSPFERQLE
jgi:inosine-uridine nucleoside N-ribohydrolase